ncbi:MAG: pitrilysin family protein, partial [Planctomycetota bacterium]
AREHSDALDTLGVQRSTDAQTRFFRLGTTMIGSKMKEALPLLFDMVRSPTLADESLGPSVDLALQSIDGLADEPQRRAMLELRARHYPDPVGRSPLGIREHLETITAEAVRKFWFERFVAGGSILGFAGSFDPDELLATVTELLGDWGGSADPAEGHGDGPGGTHHLTAESTQVHIALAYPAVAETHESRVLQQAATAVLSGGMSGRLFTEVREKRGLVYSVYASYAGQKDRGDVLAYAGTTVPRAQETLDVLTAELRRLSEGINESEFQRAIVGMKSSLVMQGESTSARAASIASDVYVFGQPRSLERAAAEVDAVTLKQLNAYVAQHPPGDMTLVTLGPEPLKAP